MRTLFISNKSLKKKGQVELDHALAPNAPEDIKEAFKEYQKYHEEIRKYEDKYQEYALG